MLKEIYKNYFLKFPKLFFIIIFIFTSIMFVFSLKLEIDASAETLLLEGDKDLEFTRKIGKRFYAPDFLVVTYTCQDNLLSDENIKNIKNISKSISSLDIVKSITNITNVPLLQSPPIPLKELIKDIPTLLSKNIDKNLAKDEFLNSPIYQENLVSNDFKTTAILINLKRDDKYFDLIKNRDRYIELKKIAKLTQKELKEFEELKLELKIYRDILREQTHNYIVKIRDILNKYKTTLNNTELHLGGANMVADDMVGFVKSDLKTFGLVIIFLLVIVLYLLFKEIKWVLIPLFISTFSIIITSGFLGLFSWEITVISSNFISLQLIMNMSLVVHLIIKYKELNSKELDTSQYTLLLQTVTSMAKPSFFVVITTMAGFSSLVFSGILPIITFGWMMSIGIVVSLITTFLLFPIIMLFFKKSFVVHYKLDKEPFTLKIASIAYTNQKIILFITILVVLFSISGATKLRVENSFIDYFKQDTQIYQGMKLIDQKLGGTTPLDIVVTFKDNSDEIEDIDLVNSSNNQYEEDELDSFEDEFEETIEDKENYWFTQAKMERIEKIHKYMDSLEPIGKVLSLYTVAKIGKTLNDGEELDTLSLALLYQELPNEYKKLLLTPYVDIENNMVRISTRIKDSMPNLKRDELLKKIDKELSTIINPKYEEIKISNLLVIYNNMLQSLFDSQIKTIGVVVFILFIMFFILFKNLKIAVIAMISNTIPVGVIFGFMGYMDIPLDMMTITIAAISIGIAVDDTIHYIYRFKEELEKNNNKKDAMYNAHKSIGTAMFYTSTIIMIGFSILVLSSYIPTIYFGLLTMIAMFMAIVADLLLLPVLLLLLP
ncbi:MAG: efflux RND transporter permease subunit [Campylobacterota bacterium]|nr:efflux RND transporter permease subunit [Campylobacterota bacterium]